MNYTVNQNNIKLANGYSLDFEYQISKTLLLKDVIVILINTPFEKIYNQNMFAIKSSGDYLWRIGEVELSYTSSNCFYSGIEINKDGELVLFNWCDTGLVVNYQTGEVLRTWCAK